MTEVFASKLMTELVGLFVVATIMESALTTLFEWRVYKEFFNGRAVKTLVMIAFGIAVVHNFEYNIFQRVVVHAGGASANSGDLLSSFLSALVLAGGSAAVYQLFKSLGLRAPAEPVALVPQPAENWAWFSVRIISDKPVASVALNYVRIKTPTDAELFAPAIVGELQPPTPVLKRLLRIFFADRQRFPAYGGITVKADDAVYRITLTFRRAGRSEAAEDLVYQGRFANRAIVDFVHTLP